MLCVYDKFTKQNEFSNCGIRILKPLSFYTYEELNGDYSVEIKYPITQDDDAWKFLLPYNIVRNSENQLFFIYDCYTEDDILTVQARHIFYYLADKQIYECKYKDFNCGYALSAIKDHTEINWGLVPESNFIEYDFSFSTDLNDKLYNIDYHGVNPVYALIGASDSIVNIYGGEIHRDNFRYSINKRKEGSKSDAFDIRSGFNMLSVRERINTENFVNVIHTEDNYGQGYSGGYSTAGYCPHQVIKHLKFSYKGESSLMADAEAYWQANNEPALMYEVSFKDLKNVSGYEKFAQSQSYNVGDEGTVYSERYQINTKQKIVSRKLNDLTGEVEEIQLKNFMPSMFRRSRYSIAQDDSAGKRLDALESRLR